MGTKQKAKYGKEIPGSSLISSKGRFAMTSRLPTELTFLKLLPLLTITPSVTNPTHESFRDKQCPNYGLNFNLHKDTYFRVSGKHHFNGAKDSKRITRLLYFLVLGSELIVNLYKQSICQ